MQTGQVGRGAYPCKIGNGMDQVILHTSDHFVGVSGGKHGS